MRIINGIKTHLTDRQLVYNFSLLNKQGIIIYIPNNVTILNFLKAFEVFDIAEYYNDSNMYNNYLFLTFNNYQGETYNWNKLKVYHVRDREIIAEISNIGNGNEIIFCENIDEFKILMIDISMIKDIKSIYAPKNIKIYE